MAFSRIIYLLLKKIIGCRHSQKDKKSYNVGGGIKWHGKFVCFFVLMLRLATFYYRATGRCIIYGYYVGCIYPFIFNKLYLSSSQECLSICLLQLSDWDDREYIEDPNDVKPVVPLHIFQLRTEIMIYSGACRDMILYQLRSLIPRLKRFAVCITFFIIRTLYFCYFFRI